MNLEVSKSTISCAVKRNVNIVREKMNKVPRLLERHKKSGVEFAQTNMNRDWNVVSVLTVNLCCSYQSITASYFLA